MSDLLNQASLVMIPSGYKEDVVYSQIPTSGAGDLSFTRASNGTRINSAGLVEVCPWNLLEYSEDFTNGVWNKYQSTISANTTTAPNGTTTADSLIENFANDVHITFQIIPISAGVNTISVYAKANTRNHIILYLYDNVSQFYFSNSFDLSNGTTTGANQSIENVGNGWYRCSYTITTTVSGSQYLYVALSNGTSISYAGNGTSGVYIWGYQANIGATAKPYFPTTDRLNVPRLTYQNGGGGCPSLLLEKQSTNLLTYSEQYDNAAWNKIQISATANNTTSPDGTQNADLITTTATGVCYTYELIAGTNGAYSASVYAKNGNNNYLALNIQNSLNNWVTSVFDLSDGSLGEYAQGSGGGIVYVNHTITPVGNGWYRCVLNYTTNQNSYFCPMFAPLKTGNSFTSAYGEAQSNANNKTIYFWGAQLEASSYPTSYIPTTSSSATRVADACSKTGISSLIGQTEGVLFIDYNAYGFNDFGRFISVTDGVNNRIGLIRNTGNNQLYFFVEVSGTLIINAAGISGTNVLGRHKIAAGYKSGDYVVYMDGVQVYTSSASGVPATSRLFLGTSEDGVLSNIMSGIISEAILFKTRLTNAELASLTTI